MPGELIKAYLRRNPMRRRASGNKTETIKSPHLTKANLYQ